MRNSSIGTIKKLVCVGGDWVAAVGEKGSCRFGWLAAVSRARCAEIDDIRIHMAVRRAYATNEDLARSLPRGAIIPLPSEKRARNWWKQDRGPKPNSRWYFESAIEAGFKPRYYLGEKINPYDDDNGALFWCLERDVFRHWPDQVEKYASNVASKSTRWKKFFDKIQDWQTKIVVWSFIERQPKFCDARTLEEYVAMAPLLYRG